MADRDVLGNLVPFVTVGQELSFRKAAERLGVSTAAVSKSVSRLEEELGVRLFNRTSRHVSLTPEGDQFLGQCAAALAAVEDARRAVQAKQEQARGELTVSLPFILGRVLVPRLPELTGKHPGLSLKLMLTDRFVRLLEEKVDVAIRIGEVGDASLVARKLMRPRWVTVAAPAYVQAHGGPRTPAELRDHNCLRFVTPRGATRDFVFAAPGKAASDSTPVRGNLRLDDGELLIEAAVAGLGLCQVFDFAVTQELRSGRLVEVLAEFSVPGPLVRWLCPPGRQRSPGVRAFLEFAHRCLAA